MRLNGRIRFLFSCPDNEPGQSEKSRLCLVSLVVGMRYGFDDFRTLKAADKLARAMKKNRETRGA
jgi:hypothetical protein